MKQPKNKHFQMADSMAEQLHYIFTEAARYAQQRRILHALLCGLRGVQ